MTTTRQFSLRLVLMAALVVTVDICVAGNEADWYLGGNIGLSNNSIDNGRITTGLYGGGITTGGDLAVTNIAKNDSSTGYKLFGGYQINSHFAIEGGYFYLGNLGFTAYTNPPGSLTGVLKTAGMFVDGVDNYAVDEKTTLHARAGLTANQAQADFSNSGAVQILQSSYSNNSAGYKIGIGATRIVNERTGIRLEGERYHLNDAVNHEENINLISLGLIYRF